MAGWMAVWGRDGYSPDDGRWERSRCAALRYGGSFAQHRNRGVAIGTWRRDSGEFLRSGHLQKLGSSTVAWTGYAVDDQGDASEKAVSLIAATAVDDVAVSRLNGAFAALVLTESPFAVRVVTDRHRQYPVYFSRRKNWTVASTDLRCLVPWLDQVELDMDSVTMLLQSGELIDRMTLLSGVEMLPPGLILSDVAGKVTERRYWCMESRGDRTAGSLDELALKLGQGLQSAVRRLDLLTEKPGITLSGGLDSRIILDLSEHPERIPSFTWGVQNCRDIRCAKSFANRVKSPHSVRHWNPGDFPALWLKGVDLTAGSCGIDSMFMLPFIPLLSSSCDVVLNGLAGDAVLGGNWLKHSWLAEANIERLGDQVWRWRVSQADEAFAANLIGSPGSGTSAREKWVASIAARPGGRPVERMNDWLIDNRVFRTTNCGTMLLRSGVESYSPFFDRDFVDIVARVPQSFKFKHRLYLEVIKQVAPRSGAVPWQRTNIRPGWGYHANLAAMAFHRGVTMVSTSLNLDAFASLRVADPPGWLRAEWRSSAQSLLLGDRAKNRGLINPKVVHEIWEEHLGGVDRTRQIGVLIALELFARLVLDGESPCDEACAASCGGKA